MGEEDRGSMDGHKRRNDGRGSIVTGTSPISLPLFKTLNTRKKFTRRRVFLEPLKLAIYGRGSTTLVMQTLTPADDAKT
jgi:hypothetical protein